jgi:hypothetical protein
MTQDVERELKQMFERRSGDVGVLPHLPSSLRHRARQRRLVTVFTLLALLVVASAGGVLAFTKIANNNGSRTRFSSRDKNLRVPPRSLRRQVPKGFRRLINRDLVLLFKDGPGYVAYSEGIFGMICADNAPRRSCFTTAQRTPIPLKGWPGVGGHLDFQKNSNELFLPHLDPQVKVLWRGTPTSGSIGIKSPGACDRIARFHLDFTCRGGVPVLLRHSVDNVEVPDVTGMRIGRARGLLRATGLVPKLVGAHAYGHGRLAVTLCEPQGSCPVLVVAPREVIVTQQDPQPGTVTKAQSKVTLLAKLRNAARPFPSASAWIRALNRRGIACSPVRNIGPQIGHQDAEGCRLSDGSLLTVLIVKNAKRAYQNHYAGSYGPTYHFFRANWVVNVPNTAPAKAVVVIRQSFGASG